MNICPKVLIVAVFSFGAGSPAAAGWVGLSDDGPLPIALEEAPRLFQQCSRVAPRPDRRFWLPSPNQIAAIENGLQAYFSENTRQLDWLTARRSRKYRGQYVGFEIAGIEYIYAAYLSDDIAFTRMADGKAIIICDGGSSAWGIVYNPNTGELRDFFGNGN